MPPFPNRVRAVREKRRLTLKQLAAVMGTDAAHLSRIERGTVEPRGITKERIAEALQQDREALFPEPEEIPA